MTNDEWRVAFEATWCQRHQLGFGLPNDLIGGAGAQDRGTELTMAIRV